MRRGDRIVAFANVLLAAQKEEMSVDLMRYTPEVAHGIMEYLFVELLLWGKAEGYRWFNFGVVPLAGLASRELAPLWTRLGALVYRHGEHFYNFRGLRFFKEKFGPVWEPRYLASPGGLTLPRTLADIAAITSGGIRGIFAR